jgi:pyruvate dehydrogenase E2 component (dihydrolipoamide acetyltransferase)
MIDVVMPQMGESITEGTLTRWLKKPGEKIERDEPLFEISTDKVDTEIPAPAAGVLSEVLVQEGATVAINSIVARIGDAAGNGAAAPATAAPAQESRASAATPASADVGPSAAAQEVRTAPPTPAQPPQAAPSAHAATNASTQPQQQQGAQPPPAPVAQSDGEETQGPLSPLVRKMAREFNIDLSQVKVRRRRGPTLLRERLRSRSLLRLVRIRFRRVRSRSNFRRAARNSRRRRKSSNLLRLCR